MPTTSYSASIVAGESTYVFFNETDKKTKKPTIQFFRVEGTDATRDTIRLDKVAVETQRGPIAAATCIDKVTQKLNIRVYYIFDDKIVEVGLDDAEDNKTWSAKGMTATGIEVAPGSFLAAIGNSGLKELRESKAKEEIDKDAVLRIYYNSKQYADMVTANTYNGKSTKWEPVELEE